MITYPPICDCLTSLSTTPAKGCRPLNTILNPCHPFLRAGCCIFLLKQRPRDGRDERCHSQREVCPLGNRTWWAADRAGCWAPISWAPALLPFGGWQYLLLADSRTQTTAVEGNSPRSKQPRGVCRWTQQLPPCKLKLSPRHIPLGIKCVAFGSKSAQTSLRWAKGGRRDLLGQQSVPAPKSVTQTSQRGLQTPPGGTSHEVAPEPIPPTTPLSSQPFPSCFISHRTPARLLKYLMSMYARVLLVSEDMLSLYSCSQSTSLTAQTTWATGLKHLCPKDQSSSRGQTRFYSR